MAIKVNKDILRGIEAVRDSGITNMLDHPRVIELLETMGHDQAATWVAENKRAYCQGIFQGFEVG